MNFVFDYKENFMNLTPKSIKRTLRKGGIYGVYSTEEKAELALKRFLKEHENYTKDDCKISEIEWD